MERMQKTGEELNAFLPETDGGGSQPREDTAGRGGHERKPDLLSIMQFTLEHNAAVLIVPDELFEPESLDKILVVIHGSIKRLRLEEMATLLHVEEAEKAPEKAA